LLKTGHYPQVVGRQSLCWHDKTGSWPSQDTLDPEGLSDKYFSIMRGGPSVAKPRARPRSVSVVTELSQRIDDGVFPTGMRLPSEPLLATQLGVSRPTLREALRSLESAGPLRRTWCSAIY